MQVKNAFLSLCCLLAIGSSQADEGEYCAIPRLVAGVPELVQVPSIDKEFCGVALINNKFVKLSDITGRVESEDPICSEGSGACKRTIRYFQKDASAPPYIIILSGPKNKNGVESYFKTT